MFNFAALMKKENGKADLESMRMFNEVSTPKLDESNLQRIIDSVNNSEYFYTYKGESINSNCNKAVCRTVAYGIGEGQVDIERYPCSYITEKNWFADNRDGVLKSQHTLIVF